MLVLISYDVSFEDPGGQRRLRRIAKTCQEWATGAVFRVRMRGGPGAMDAAEKQAAE